MSSDEFFDRLKAVQQVIRQHDGDPSALPDIKALLQDDDVRREFFNLLDRPDWIRPLCLSGYFLTPPPREQIEGGGVRYPTWPPSRYLARMATQAPSDIADILADIRTDNPSIIGDLLDAAAKMPLDVAVSLVPAICRATQEGNLWVHFADASDLCAKLAAGAKTESAVALAESLFAPRFNEGQDQPAEREAYWYKKGLKKVIPLLAVDAPSRFMPRLCGWLKESIGAKEYEDPESDFSYVWRPAIEEHEQNLDYDFAGVMAGFVREGFEYAISSGHMALGEALEVLARYRYQVFRRLELHLVNRFAEQDKMLARKLMMNRELFGDYYFKHEYAMLVGDRLPLLTDNERDTWFGWVEAGPDTPKDQTSVASRLQDDEIEEKRQQRVRYWKFERLHWVRKHLTGERKQFYQEMLAEQGEPELADLNVRMGLGRSRSDSPMTVEDLAALTFEAAVDTVASWQPERPSPIGPDISGLASVFAECVGNNPEAWSRKAGLLVGRPAIYVRRFISSMNDAVKAGKTVDVAAVLELCRWVISRPAEEPSPRQEEEEPLVDKNWQWVRDNISGFIEEVCKAREDQSSRYPMDGLRELMWQVIDALCRDRAETYIVSKDAPDDPRLRDYLELGINSPRGKAVMAALEYARWVANHLKQTHDGRSIVPGGLDAMPEVRAMLQWQLDPENRSFEALSVIGSRWNLLYWIDKSWLADVIDRIFDLANAKQSPIAGEGWAAWNAFLVWVRPYIEYYRLLQKQFAYAVGQSSTVQLPGNESRGQPMFRLGEHLVLLYGWGQLGFDDDDGLLRRFLVTANSRIRMHAVGFVGQVLERDAEIPEDIIKRFMKLWEFYWANTGPQDAKERPGTWLFGSWFACHHFPQQWSLDRLQEYVAVDPAPEPDQTIVERLAMIAPHDVTKAVAILDVMIRGDHEGWRIQGWIDPAMEILKLGINGDEDARDRAVKLINHLGRLGHVVFGKLLHE